MDNKYLFIYKNCIKFFPSFCLILIYVTTSCSQDDNKATSNEKYKDCCGTVPKVIELPKNSVFVPNAFTPNGDGINDYFYPIAKNQNIKNIAISRIKIFNMSDTVIYYQRDFRYDMDFEITAWSGQMGYNIFNETNYKPDQKFEGGPFKYSFELFYELNDGSFDIKLIEGQACMIICEDDVAEFQDRKGCFYPVQGLNGVFEAQIGNQEKNCFK